MNDPLRTGLCERLGIELPILLAPMAGGPSTPELVGAVSRAGGLGVHAATGTTPDDVREAVARAVARAEGRPVGVNVQLAPPRPGAGDAAALRAVLAPLEREVGAAPAQDAAAAAPLPSPVELVQAGLEAGATVVSGALGDPASLATAAAQAGVPLLAMVSSVAEARAAVAAGADVLIAQGWEAGGHRTTFDVDAAPLPAVGALALVPAIVDAVGVPVAAAGGIADGRGLAAALALGAQGVSVGTRFLLSEEAGVPDVLRDALARLDATDTFVTTALTGRPARWVRNRLAGALDAGPPPLGWVPEQRALLGPLRTAAAQAGREDLLPILAGQAAALDPRVLPAERIVRELADGARAVLGGLAG